VGLEGKSAVPKVRSATQLPGSLARVHSAELLRDSIHVCTLDTMETYLSSVRDTVLYTLQQLKLSKFERFIKKRMWVSSAYSVSRVVTLQGKTHWCFHQDPL
jgi:hypothetical protein